MLTLSAAQALGRLGEAEGVALLRMLLHSDIARSISTLWLACSPHLATTPTREWPHLDLQPAARCRLFSLLTAGQTDADQPGSFAEFIQAQATEVRMAIASALAELGRHTSPVSQQEIRSTLLACVQQAGTLPGHETRHLLACLARASNDEGLSDLGQMLSNPALDSPLRWLVVEQLSETPESTPILVRCLEQSILDSFTRSKLAYTLGRQGSLLALPALRRLAEQRDEDAYVRSQAIAGLGLLDDSAVETTLLHIVADVTTPPVLRGAAAEALPVRLRADMRHWLYELLHRERQPPELVAGVLQTLGRARDHEALSIMLHYIQHEHPLVARAALSALAELEETSVAPNIIRIAQNNTLDQSVRLHAVGVLLRLCGAEYLPLLRSYLDSNVLSLQLQAMDYLMTLRPDDSRPLVLVAHKTAPQALRIRAVELLAQRTSDHGTLCNVLLDNGDDVHVRLAAAAVLAESPYAQAIPTLARCAAAPETPLRLHRACIDALGSQASSPHPTASSARLVLGQLVDDAQQPAENRFWAAAALLRGLS
jgi:HEAT repeat protein